MVITILKLLTKLLVSPLVFSFILMCIAFAAKKLFAAKKTAHLLMALGLVYLFLASQYTISNALLYPLEYKYEPHHAADYRWQQTQLIMTPACYYFDFDELPQASKWPMCSMSRLVQVALLYKTKPTKIAVTGGKFLADKTKPYAPIAAELLVNLGVAAEDIIVIPDGTNTQEEFVALFGQSGNVPITVVTSATHMYRSIQIAKKTGFTEVIPMPTEHLSPPQNEISLNIPAIDSLYNVQRALYEYLAIAYLKISS